MCRLRSVPGESTGPLCKHLGMSPTLARPRIAPPKNVGGSLMVSAGVAAVVVVAAALLPGMRLPTFVRRVTVTNATPYGIEVEVTNPQRDGWIDLGGFPPSATRPVYQVIDQGANWVFRFTHGPDDVGQIAMSRAELKRTNWRVTIPAELGDRLAAAGRPASARVG